MIVEWRPVDVLGYEVSSEGDVRSVDRIIQLARGGTRRLRGKMLQQVVNPRGYRYVSLYHEGKQHTRTVHSLVAEAFLGPRPRGLDVRHKNGRHGECQVSNLEYGTRGENQFDQVAHGTHANAAKKACKRKHLLVSPNLVESALPRRDCKACAWGRGYVRGHPELNLVDVANDYYERIMKECA
jgi:hypothetical protein